MNKLHSIQHMYESVSTVFLKNNMCIGRCMTCLLQPEQSDLFT